MYCLVTSNPRPTIMRPSSRSSRHTPSDFSDFDDDDELPWAPEPPLDSPTFTVNSSPTAYSSQLSSYGFPPSHWAENIFNGQLEQSGVRTSFRGAYQMYAELCTNSLHGRMLIVYAEVTLRLAAWAPLNQTRGTCWPCVASVL